MVALIIRPASPWTHNTTISDMVLFFREEPRRAQVATPSAGSHAERRHAIRKNQTPKTKIESTTVISISPR